MSTLVKGQHVIWAHLLRGWEIEGRMWCLRRPAEKPFRTQSTSVAKETFFYRVETLTREDLDRLAQTVNAGSDPRLRGINQGWVGWVQRVFETKARLDTPSLSPEDRKTIGDELAVLEKTMIERWHTGVEQRALAPLAQLRAGSVDFYDDPTVRNNWITYVAFQFFRTSSMKNRLRAMAGPLWTESFARTWPIECLIWATNVGASLAGRPQDYGCAVVERGSEIAFITGDQPVINLKTERDEELHLYMPLSSSHAVFLGPKAEIGPPLRHASAMETERLNHAIFSRSENEIYGSDPAYLQALGQLDKFR